MARIEGTFKQLTWLSRMKTTYDVRRVSGLRREPVVTPRPGVTRHLYLIYVIMKNICLKDLYHENYDN